MLLSPLLLPCAASPAYSVSLTLDAASTHALNPLVTNKRHWLRRKARCHVAAVGGPKATKAATVAAEPRALSGLAASRSLPTAG